MTRREIPSPRSIKRIVRKIFEIEKKAPAALSITYVNGGRIKKLNLEYRHSGYRTDVLAFGMREGKRLKGDRGYLGDIVISIDAAGRRAKEFLSTRERELKLYLIHGLLHLLGYEDETEGPSRKMRRREEYLLNRI